MQFWNQYTIDSLYLRRAFDIECLPVINTIQRLKNRGALAKSQAGLAQRAACNIANPIFMQSVQQAAHNLGFWRGFLLPISLYVFLGADYVQFGILARVSSAYLTLCIPRSGPHTIWYFSGSIYCLSHVMQYSEWAAHNLGFWRVFLVTASLYVVLGAGHAQFGIFSGSFYYLSHFIQSSVRAARNLGFWWNFILHITIYVFLDAGGLIIWLVNGYSLFYVFD